MRKQFAKTLQNILYKDSNSVVLLGDIGVFAFRKEIEELSDRVYNIGILEQSTVSLAAGLSKNGIIPFVHTIAPFMVERAFEQIKIDFGYQNLNGNFISVGSSYDYAGLGCTHHCPGDVSLMLTVENMHIFLPGNSKELDDLVNQSYVLKHPKYYRLSEYEHSLSLELEYGKAKLIKRGQKATIICYGPMLQQVYEATEDLDVTVLYYNTVYPFDCKTLLDNLSQNIIICEPFYIGTTNYLITNAIKNTYYKIHNIGVPRKFLKNYGNKQDHDQFLSLDTTGIKNQIESCLIS
jgi:transketolase